MQARYLAQFQDLYEDFHLVKMPLRADEVRGREKLGPFSQMLVEPFVPEEGSMDGPGAITQLEKEVEALRKRVAEVEGKN